MTRHQQVRVRAGGQDARVDAGMADLIRECWRADIWTVMSCENHRTNDFGVEQAWLHLWVVDAEQFLHVVAGDLLTNGVARSFQGLFARAHGTTPLADEGDRWEFDTLLIHGDQVRIYLNIWFPVQDIPLITQRLREHNAARRAGRAEEVRA